MKTIIKKIGSLLLVFSSILALSFHSNAITIQNETESNDTYATADILSLGNSINGTLSKFSDIDIYKISPSSDGKISLHFNHTYEDSDYDWVVTVYYYSNNSYCELSSTAILLKSSESFQIPPIGAVASGQYYVKVNCSYGSVAGIKYTISSSFEATSCYEKEINNSYPYATPIISGNKYSGSMGKFNDIDVYKFTAPNEGKLSLEFIHPYENNYSSWDVLVYKKTQGSYTLISATYTSLRGSEIVSIPCVGVNTSDEIYIVIDGNEYDKLVGINYDLLVKFTQTALFEKEENNSYTSANPVELGKTYSGVINKFDDKDYFCFTSKKSETINIIFNHTYYNKGNSFGVFVYKYDNGNYTELSRTFIAMNQAESFSIPKINTKANEKYYIEVYNSGEYDELVGKEYSLKFGSQIIDNKPDTDYAKFVLPSKSIDINLNSTYTLDCKIETSGAMSLNVKYSTDTPDIVDCSWGSYSNGIMPLEITGIKEGNTVITVTLIDRNTKEVLDEQTINVFVLDESPTPQDNDVSFFEWLISIINMIVNFLFSWI